ncbi:MAG: hypothetical protein IIY62_05130 [Kiritimatiellae bacterium]|nr:hypothetical protein [Kiritimatiellia bacterium]
MTLGAASDAGDKYLDGRPVEKIFVTGNHDWVGFTYGRTAKKRYPDHAEREKHLLPRDMAGWWDKAFHEEYKPLYAKTVLAEGFNQSLKHAKAKSPQVCFFAKDELGTGPVTFVVTPVNSLGQCVQPLTAILSSLLTR